MSYRERHRVDWDEEIRKTERIRRRGLFVSAMSFGVAAIFIIGANRMNGFGVDVLRKIVFALCLIISGLLLRIVLRRRERLKRERRDEEQARRFLQASEAREAQDTEE